MELTKEQRFLPLTIEECYNTECKCCVLDKVNCADIIPIIQNMDV